MMCPNCTCGDCVIDAEFEPMALPHGPIECALTEFCEGCGIHYCKGCNGGLCPGTEC